MSAPVYQAGGKMDPSRVASRWKWRAALALALSPVACGGSVNGIDDSTFAELSCTISNSEIFSGGPGKDGIPALTNPLFVSPGASGSAYLLDEDRVIGLAVENELLAIPINILWWHEIVNLDIGGRKLAVTHCPLTGSSLVFDRASIDGAELGVSGLLYRNNLIMYDRNAQESLWPQMERGARCGSRSGAQLSMFPAWEMTWEGWRTLHPQTTVVSSATDYRRSYRSYPYGDYDRINNRDLLFPLSQIDDTRPPKERVLGIPDGEAGRAYPYGLLETLGPEAIVEGVGDVIFWDSQRQAAMAFSTLLDGQRLDFVFSQGEIRDKQTQSVWRIDGLAVSGPMAGKRLEPVAEAYVSYWFAWAAFHPNATLGITQ
jgi:hypothetical protein